MVGYRVKYDLGSRAVTSATALHVDGAAVEIDKILRNRQTQPKPTELAAEGRISLLEWHEERSLPLDFNPDSVINDLKLKTTVIIV